MATRSSIEDLDAPLGRREGSQPVTKTLRGTVAPWIALAGVVFAASLVYWAFDAIPFQDLPAHAGLIALRHRFAASPFEQRFFVFAPHLGPYSLFRFLGDRLAPVLGPMGAVRAIGMLPGIAMPAALIHARRTLHGDASPAIGYLGVVLSLGLLTLFGLASYLLGLALLIVVLTLWLDLLSRARARAHGIAAGRATRGLDRPWREATVAALALLLFVAHGDAYVIFLLLAVVACLVAPRPRRFRELWTLGPSLAVAAWVAWIEWTSTTPAGSVAIPRRVLAPRFQGLVDKLSLLATPTLMTRTGLDVLAGLLVWALLIGAAAVTLRDLRRGPQATLAGDGRDSAAHSKALYAGALCLSIAFLALPHAIGWFGFVDGRIVPVMLLLGGVAYRRQSLTARLRAGIERGLPAIACVMTGLALVSSARFQREAQGYEEVLAMVPAGARLLNLPLDPNSDVFTAHPFIHYDKLVMARRPVVVSDVWFHQGSALYPTADNPVLALPASYSESNLRVIDWPAYRLQDWDYVLVRTRPLAAAPVTPQDLTLAMHAGGWWLYATGARR
jgi:hypothetical protein